MTYRIYQTLPVFLLSVISYLQWVMDYWSSIIRYTLSIYSYLLSVLCLSIQTPMQNLSLYLKKWVSILCLQVIIQSINHFKFEVWTINSLCTSLELAEHSRRGAPAQYTHHFKSGSKTYIIICTAIMDTEVQ